MKAWKGILGKFGPADQNESGQKVLDLCALNGLVVTNTPFPH